MLANSILIIPTPINVILFGICSKETHMIHVDDEPLKGFYSAHIAKLMDKLATEGVQFFERFIVNMNHMSFYTRFNCYASKFNTNNTYTYKIQHILLN
jgi:hypothetical protein